MNDYELTVLVRPDASEKELEKTVKSLQTLLEKNGAKIKNKRDPEKKSLSYEIGHHREAYYVYFEISVSPSDVGAIESKVKLEDNLVRYLLVRKE